MTSIISRLRTKETSLRLISLGSAGFITAIVVFFAQFIFIVDSFWVLGLLSIVTLLLIFGTNQNFIEVVGHFKIRSELIETLVGVLVSAGLYVGLLFVFINAYTTIIPIYLAGYLNLTIFTFPISTLTTGTLLLIITEILISRWT